MDDPADCHSMTAATARSVGHSCVERSLQGTGSRAYPAQPLCICPVDIPPQQMVALQVGLSATPLRHPACWVKLLMAYNHHTCKFDVLLAC